MPIVHLRGRTYFVRVGGQLAFGLVTVTSVAQKCPVVNLLALNPAVINPIFSHLGQVGGSALMFGGAGQ